MSLWSRLRNTLFPQALDAELEDEAQAHLDQLQESGVDGRAFGNVLRYREESRDIKSLPWLDSLRADVVFGWRQIRKRKSLSAAVVVSLGLGIGATTSALRLVESGFLRPLAIRAPERLHFLRYTAPNLEGKQSQRDSFSYAEYVAMSQALKGDAELLMVSFADRQDISFGGAADVEKVSRQFVSGRLFEDFGIRPAAGRLFGVAEDKPAADHRVAVIGHDYWKRRFGLTPVIGRSFQYAGQSYSIIGVVEPSFTGTSPGAYTDVFLPLLANEEATRGPHAAQWTWARILVHLEPHTSEMVARDRLRATFARFREEVSTRLPPGTPPKYREFYTNARLHLLPAAGGVSNFHRDYLLPLAILTVTALLVLLLCCVSAANLLISQGAARAREMAVRVSAGASRRRLIQLLLTESLLLAMLAAGLGLLFSWWSTPYVVGRLNPPDNPVRLPLSMDGVALLLASLLALAVTVLCGVAPALHASSTNAVHALKAGFDLRRRLRLMRVLVSAQVAFCVIVCLVASLLMASLRRIHQVPLGFVPDRVLLVETAVTGAPPGQEMWRQLVTQAGELPGVRQAALSTWPVQTGSISISPVQVPGRPVDLLGPYILPVSPGWFAAMSIPFREGRDFRFDGADDEVIVNEQFARHYFGGRSPVGERVLGDNRAFRIIGVTGDIRMRDAIEAIQPAVYIPFAHMRNGALTLRLQGTVPEAGMARQLRQLLAQQFPQLRVDGVRTYTDLIEAQTVRERLLAALSSFFGMVALILAGTGLYALLSYAVTQRRHEIAIRMALGASGAEAARLVLREAVISIACGVVMGLGAGCAAQRVIRSLLFEVSGSDPGVLGMTMLAIATSSLLAAAVPALRAVQMDPTQTLRAD